MRFLPIQNPTVPFRLGRAGLLIAATLCLALTAALAPAASDSSPDRVVIGAFNAENFVDVYDDPYSKDEVVAVKPRAEIEKLAKAIRAANADALAVEEVENEGVLKAMVRELLPDMGYRYVTVNPTNSEYGTNLGIISRLPIISVTSHRWRELRLPGETRTWKFTRDLLRVRLAATPTRALDIFVVHFHSRHDVGADNNAERWRLAEAVAARQIVAGAIAAEPDAWVALVGDFNDTPQTPPLAQLTAPLDGASALLVDAHAGLAAESRITYLKSPYRSTIDYVLASPALAKRLVPNSARVVTEKSTLGGSDHAPVVAAFDLRDAPRR